MDFGINKEFLKPQADFKNLEGTQKKLTLAGKQNEAINKEHRNRLNTYYDKILFYSAGAFSFTLALIGLVVDDKTQALAKIGFLLPNIYWLYCSWLLFLLAGILVLISRKLDAYYIANFGMSHYTKAYKNYVIEEYEWVQKNSAQIVMSESFKEFKQKFDDNLQKLTDANKNSNEKERFYYKTMRFCCVTAEISAALGIIFVLLFGVQLTQTIIWP